MSSGSYKVTHMGQENMSYCKTKMNLCLRSSCQSLACVAKLTGVVFSEVSVSPEVFLKNNYKYCRKMICVNTCHYSNRFTKVKWAMFLWEKSIFYKQKKKKKMLVITQLECNNLNMPLVIIFPMCKMCYVLQRSQCTNMSSQPSGGGGKRWNKYKLQTDAIRNSIRHLPYITITFIRHPPYITITLS